MTFEAVSQTALDYLPCRYGKSKLLFRGPRRNLDKPYIAFLGGNETYGKFIAEPFVDLLDQYVDYTCVNFGCLNAGVDVFLQDQFVPEAARKSALTVLQVPSAQNMTNRLYSVHPRRNDRFVSPTAMLKTIFPEVDFAGFHFNKHMVKHLRDLSPERFRILEQELNEAWVARMLSLLAKINGRVVLLWVSSRSPSDTSQGSVDPLFVTDDMMQRVIPSATEYVEAVLSPDACANPTDGMVFSQMEAPAAQEMVGPLAHQEVASKLLPVLRDML
ncbi:MAG: DUF6473 family protein [Pseudomonadota bacterium]